MCTLCTAVIMVHKGTNSSYMQVGRLYRALILIGLALYLLSPSASSVFMFLYVYLKLFVTFFALSFSELCMMGLALDLVD